MDEINQQEMIQMLERACDLFDKIQGKKAILEAEEILSEKQEEGNG